MRDLYLSDRAHDKILKVARTIADLAEAETIQPEHVQKRFSTGISIANWGGRIFMDIFHHLN